MEQNGRARQPVPNIRSTPGYIIFLDTPLGQGATSKVYGGRHKKLGKRVACKVPHTANLFRMGTDMERESQVLLRLRNQNIVCLEAIEKDQISKENILIMELCTGGSLYDVLEKPENSCGLAEKAFLQVLADMTAGMKYLRDNGVVHRDVKPGNIMCFKDDHGHTIYKLADFGAARQLTDDENFTSLHGTEEYLHPKVFERAVLRKPAALPFDARIDLWSIGATLYHLATGQLPFRPHGGRKNSRMMFHLTTKKAPGVISGVQTGPLDHEITWSRELPETCRLSIGLKKLITPLLAGLLESNPSTVWSFQHFFQASQAITTKIAIDVFWVCEASYMKIYCSLTDRFAEFQENIASQTKLSATKQSILYNGETFKPDGILPISSYPITSVANPITLSNKEQIHVQHQLTPPFVATMPALRPRFSTQNDYPIAKGALATGCILQTRQKMIHEMHGLFDQYVITLRDRSKMDVLRLQDHHKLVKGKLSIMSTHLGDGKRILNLLRNTQEGRISDITHQLERKLEEGSHDLMQFEMQSNEIDEILNQLHLDVFVNDILQSIWKPSQGCNVQDEKCSTELVHLTYEMEDIYKRFSRDKKTGKLSYNEEQIHKMEKLSLGDLMKRTMTCIGGCEERWRSQHKLLMVCHNKAYNQRQQLLKADRSLAPLVHQCNVLENTISDLHSQSHFEIGTEVEPFQHEASVVMHGHVRSVELPLFGAKTFAVRNGTVDMHGIPTPITWSRLAETVNAGDTELTLMDSVVNWRIGDHMVLASTGTRHKQTQNEEVEITGFSNDNMTIEFTPALEYEHISISQVIDGILVETRGEVGLLTHNVKIRGSVHEEWLEEVEACPDEFDTNQFATQTCFQGRFGAETVTDEFGSQIMFFAKEQDTHLVRGRFEYVEVTHAGQAFRLGRYPIHFHMNGNITGSYVRGCGIHHTFNRAVTIHGVHHLLVEHNVAFNVMGHAFFLEDGIETKNIIQYNLAVFVRPSSSLLNVDVTPASFWVTNPDNYVRHNAAAGGSHFGFWYNMPAHPMGPSFTTAVCPRNVQVLEFNNNTAHTMGWYGIWIFPSYHPKADSSCGGVAGHTEFHNLTAWRTERGAEGVLVGPIQFHNFLMTDNEASGIEFQTVGSVWGEDGPMVKDSVIIGYTPGLAEGQEADRCTSAGIHLPKSKFLTVDGVRFINFDQDRCVTLRACAHCKVFQGGFEHRFKNLIFTDSPNKAAFQWEHETWFEDLDGTLTGNADSIVTPQNNGLPTDHCTFDVEDFSKGFNGAVCDESVLLHRMAFNDAYPESLHYKATILTNSYGTTSVPYRKKRITHPTGWMLTLVESETYNFYFENVDHVTNISYAARFDGFGDGDFVIMNHNFTQSPDAFALIGQVTENVGRPLEYSEDENADWYFNNETNNLYYLISGRDQSSLVDRSVNLDVYRCYYKDCIPPVPSVPPPPPEGRPEGVLFWGEAAAWEDVTDGWGGNTGSGSNVPQNGDDVMIFPERWIVANDTLPWMNKLFIYGTLEIDDSRDMVINATYILIQGGRLIAGFNETRPFTHDLRILLNGHHFTQDIPLPNGPNLGSKALGVFGTLDLHGMPRDVTWTQLASTVEAGDSEFTVIVDTDWRVGDEIVVTATSYEAWHTETFRISSKTDSRTFSINGTFAHMHTAESAEFNGKAYTIAAEVGLLTRNIVIEGSDYDLLFDESFGARTIVGSFIQDGEFYRGSGHFANVEFKRTGQEGWTDFYDPRYSLAFLDIGDVLLDAVPSFVHSCTFHNGFSLAIGVFGTDNIEIDNNVIHHTVGAGIKSYGTNTMITNNLVTLMVFPGTYQDRFEDENIDWMGGIDVAEAMDPILINNTVAGSERVGFNIKGERCSDPNAWSNNVAHSNYHGVHILKTGQDPCLRVHDFFSYRNLDYGLYALTSSSIEISESTFVDNGANILVHDYGPSALSHLVANKYVLVEDSLIVGNSDSFDCDLDKVTPEGSSQSSKQRSTKSPNGGTVGVYFTSFKGSSGGAPFKPFTSVMSYPAIGGKMILRDVTFSNFNDKCSGGDKVIMTSPQSGDAMHPIEVEGLTFIDTPTDNYVWFHRPPLGLVNPSDCVDMDCDAHKKVIIQDVDGSLLGSPGTVIPDSAFEWDGDRRRGLGDYRIPKMMLTTPEGARIPKEDVAPNNGIIRNDDCEWHDRWQAWECHGIDHMMMIVESMDADTELRRVSPVALHADGYVDLINGPQDHGWCLGYTCQERISTFYTIVATNKNYELFFTGTNPQSLRFHLLNAVESQALTVGIWYANPQRLDVYVDGLYIIPNNGQYVDGGLQWIAPTPDTDFMPSLDSMVLGDNYFDREKQTLYILVRGSTFVEIRTTPVVITTFGVPAVEVDDFFEENLVENLANLLNIDPSQIRVVDIISEARRKKRSTGSDTEVVVEIGANPVASISTDNSTTTPAPSGTSSPSELSFDQLTEVQAMLADEMQTGNLGDSLGVTINSMAMTDPVDTPKDPTGGVRATNTTGGPANGTTTFAEQQAAEEELALSTAGEATVYVVASTMIIEVQPDDAIEESAFGTQPRIKVLDNQGNRIEQLGTPARPWQVTATISSWTSDGIIGFISDNQTISFEGGWANFTDLGVNISATDLVLEFTITYPNTSRLTASSEAFDVDVQPYEVEIITAPSSDVMENEVFEVIVELRETHTGDVPTNLAEKGFDSWLVTIGISDPTNYRGELQGDLSVILDLSTARASFSLSINEASYYYILTVSVVTSPSSAYHASGSLDPFNVVAENNAINSGETASLTIRFDYDYSSIAQDNEELIAANFLNHIAPNYENATFSNVQVSEGSILISFDITGDVESVQSLIWEDILDGDLSITFNGQTLLAEEYLMVDGAPYDPTSSSSSLPIWIIIVVVVVILILIAVIVIAVIMVKKNSNRKVTQMDEMPLATTKEYGDNKDYKLMSYVGSESSLIHPSLAPTIRFDHSPSPDEGLVNKHLLFDDETDSQRSTLSARSRSPGLHLARRSPEVAVSALPPGFLEGQMETELADRVRLFIMVKNSDGTFQKLGEVSANMVGTISQLRHDLKDTGLSHKVRDKPFVILKETLAEIQPGDEKKLMVNEVYSSDCVLLKWLDNQDITQLCICGLVGQFHCSLCQKQAYCSPQCQSTDWPRHSFKCSQWATE